MQNLSTVEQKGLIPKSGWYTIQGKRSYVAFVPKKTKISGQPEYSIFVNGKETDTFSVR